MYKSLQFRLHGWDRNTHWEVMGIKLAFKATKANELVGKECSQKTEGVAGKP